LNVTWANVPDANITESSVTQHQAALSISTSQLAGGLSLSDITDVTATAAEVNVLDGVTATTAELNYTDGVTSNIQTQLDSKVGANYTGDVDITGELLVDSYNETFKKVSSVVAYISYDLNTAAYASKSLSVNSQDTFGEGLFFKPDGTVMYYLGSTTNGIYQYSLSTAFDISTATYASKVLSVGLQNAGPRDLFFKSDGTKVYMLGDGGAGNFVYQYSLSTAWDISTGSYDSVSFSVNTQETIPTGLFFKPDGTSMYIVGQNADNVRQYTLSTAWDISTASYASKTFSINSQESAPTALAFSDDGSLLFVIGTSSDAVNVYALSTAWDVSTGTFSYAFSVAGQETLPSGFCFADSGNRFYIVGESSPTVYQYNASSTQSITFDCENANVFETVLDGNTTVVFSNPPAAGTATDSTAYAMSLKVVQDAGASGYTVTWPTSVNWPSATAPTLTATASAVDQFVFYTHDGGTTWYGFTAGQDLG
jgi:hypothetical protein